MADKTPTKPTDAPVDMGHLAQDISFVTRALRAYLRNWNAEFFSKHAVAPGEVAILNLISLNPGISQKDLAAAVVLKKSALTKAVNEMESSDLIERQTGDGDRRVRSLHLTAKGQARVQSMAADMAKSQDTILSALSPAERKQLFEMMWKIMGTMSELTDGA